MNKQSILGVSVLVLMLAGCENTPSEPAPTYAEHLASLATPKNESERQQACSYLRSEIARIQNEADFMSAHFSQAGTPLQANMAMFAQNSARSNTALIEAKAAEFRCSAAFAERLPQSGIEACVATCKANTSRTSEQCFDSCNK